jgi:lysophospholipase L1-like esterase
VRRSHLGTLVLIALTSSSALAQNVSGHAFEDRNANGIQDPGEPSLPGVSVRLAGKQDAGPLVDATVPTDGTGSFLFSPGNGCYVLQPADPAGWRLSSTRWDGVPASTPGYTEPVGQLRFSKLDQGIPHLQAGTFRITAMGDSIARNFNFCSSTVAFWYTTQVQSWLLCAFPSATSAVDQAAQLGETTDDLLVDDTDNNMNNVFRVIEAQPQLITISAIGNDVKNVDPPANPTPAQVNKAVAEILDSRQNLQEILSVLTSQVPGSDIVLNSLYDNLAYNCSTGNSTDFHRAWLPIVNRILRDLAWGQTRRASINEVAAEFAHEDLQGGCTGFEGEICRNFFDNIHPNSPGYEIVREKLWEATGGVNLGPKDEPQRRTSITGADQGFLRRVRRLYPTTWETRNGASVVNPSAATSDLDGGAAAQITLGAGTEEFRLSGFPGWYDEIQIVRVLAGVRYRTTGTVADDFYRMEASVTGQFRPQPPFDYTPTNWNFYTPLVGGGGPNQPPENADYPMEKLLALPNVATLREVTATLTKNPTLAGGAAEYQWPSMTQSDLATTTIRVASAPVAGTAGNDNYQVQLEAAWLDLYGWEKPRPPEISGSGGGGGGGGEAMTVDQLPDGSLVVTFDAVPGAQRYNLYLGRLATVSAGGYDHGSGAPTGPMCNAPTQSAGPGRLSITVPSSSVPGLDTYLLVTAHVDDVESPSGFRSDGTEIDRSQSTCR